MAVPAERYEEVQTVDYVLVPDVRLAVDGLRHHRLELVRDAGIDTEFSPASANIDAQSATPSARSSIELYLHQIGQYELLEPHQEVELARAIEAGVEAESKLQELEARNNPISQEKALELQAVIETGQAAKELMINSNLRLVVWLAKGYREMGVPLLDLIQEGNLGLDRAVDKYDWRKGIKFNAYAKHWINLSLNRAISKQANIIRVPDEVVKRQRALRRTHQWLRQELKHDPSIEELSERSGVSIEHINDAMNAPLAGSLNIAVKPGSAEIGDVIADPNAADPLEKTAEALQRADLYELIQSLPDRERQIIQLRYGFGCEPHSYAAIGQKLGLTAGRIRQLDIETLDKFEVLMNPKVAEEVDDDPSTVNKASKQRSLVDWPAIPESFVVPESIEASHTRGIAPGAKSYVAYCLASGITDNAKIAWQAQRSANTVRQIKHAIYRDLGVTKVNRMNRLQEACAAIRQLQPEVED